MASSDKAKGGFTGVAFAIVISFIAICVSMACIVHVFFLSAPYTQCSCPHNEVRATPELLRDGKGKAKEARGPPKDNADTVIGEDAVKRVKQPGEERRVRKRRATQNKAQTNGDTTFGGYLHNAILRLQQQMIVVEGR